MINEDFKIKTLLLFVKLILLIINLQTGILGLLADFNVIAKTSILSSRATAERESQKV